MDLNLQGMKRFKQLPFELGNYDLSARGVLLYIEMLDRYKLSVKNHWYDISENRIYIYFTLKEIAKNIRCCNQTAINTVKELIDKGLICKKRIGLTQPNRYYMNDIGCGSGKVTKNHNEERVNEGQGTTNHSCQRASEPTRESEEQGTIKPVNLASLQSTIKTSHINLEEKEKVLPGIHEQIKYQELCEEATHKAFKNVYKVIEQVMLSVYTTDPVKTSTIKIKNIDIPIDHFFSRYKLLEKEDIKIIANKFLTLDFDVKNTSIYIRTMLYNYLDEKNINDYKKQMEAEKQTPQKYRNGNKFINFKEREWDFAALERELYE